MAADGSAFHRPLVVSIVGTRPEAIKMAPVVRAIAECSAIRQELIFTGQHASLDTPAPAPAASVRRLHLNLSEQTAGEIAETLRDALRGEFVRSRPDLVLVQGDTSSALAGALAASDCGCPVGHVEAGLRSGDLQQPWPEEGHRIRIDSLSALLFAPSERSANALRRERVTGAIHVTGNSGIDALLDAHRACDRGDQAEGRKSILVTCHRRENWGRLEEVAVALKRLARETTLEIAFILHSNPKLRRRAVRLLGAEPGVTLLNPVDHQEMVSLMSRSWLIMTDSGGLQEEAPALGRPVLVLRDVTERDEGLESGNLELVGTDPDRIFEATMRLLHQPELYARMSRPSFPFGDGLAAPRIAAVVEQFLMDTAQDPRQEKTQGVLEAANTDAADAGL